MKYTPPVLLAILASVGIAVSPAGAFHRSLAGVTAITTSGDLDLPRVPPQGRKVMVLARPKSGGGEEVVKLNPFTTFGETTQLGTQGTEPAVAYSGRAAAWETTADLASTGLPGSQIVIDDRGAIVAGPADPSGTSHKPSLDKRGRMLAFESAGDLTGIGVPGVTRVYVYDRNLNFLDVASMGVGQSGDAMVSAKGRGVTFASTSDPSSGADTGISQVWVGDLVDLPADRVTSGAGPSTEPIVSDDGRLVTFSSTADLAGDGHDTGVSQVFVYDVRTQTYAQITADPSGCHRPAVSRVRSDWRVSYVCSGDAFYYMVREDKRYHVESLGGDTLGIFPEMGVHFVMLSTTADLGNPMGPPTSGHRIFLRNLYAQPAPEVIGEPLAVWFPTRGIPSL